MRRPWIKIETCTPDKPEVCSLATQLRLDEDTVVGKLVRLWSWAELNRIDPNDLGVTREFIDKLVGRKGFGAALEKAGWLVEVDGKLSFRNFKRHNSPVAQNKALTAKRVARHRLRKAEGKKKVTNEAFTEPFEAAIKAEEIGEHIDPVQEVTTTVSELIVSDEGGTNIDPVVNEEVTVIVETVEEMEPVADEPDLPPLSPVEDEVAAVVTEEPAPKKRRGKAAAENDDQPMLF
ncbi:hypothetical protein [Prosthecobacter sp.]|uniref:hypothetical protein n=1 Tax=Prosthecobacter sp. TaxID=1965333 RepID=UPI00378306E5